VIPWSGGAVTDVAAAAACAERIGYPLMIKASAGGGGRGIRAVDSESEIATAFESATAEGLSAFGDPTVFIERRLRAGRHIEVQIAADAHGNAVAYGCRDCSVQRRHQKVLEEAPPPGLGPALIDGLEQAAVRLVAKVGYVGVGTVEFLVADGAFYFLEVNPRLQVEHGITEEITGIDLVQLQIRIARGEKLPPRPAPRPGVAIEARVCAEDPEADFLPAPGDIEVFDPALGPRIRVDSGVAAGCSVPPDFDSLIAKVIACGDTREEARARLACALTDFELVVVGGASNKGYLVDLLDTEQYRTADYDTEWLDRSPELRAGSNAHAVEALVAAAILFYQRVRDVARRAFFADPTSLTPTSIPASTGQRIDLSRGGESYRIEVFAVGAWRYRVHLDGRVTTVKLRSKGARAASLEIGGRSLRVLHDLSDRGVRVEVEAHPYRFSSELAGQVRAGTPAMVITLGVEIGDRVEAGQTLGLLEAMKMEIGFQAEVTGVVKEIAVRSGQQVASGELLLVIDVAEEGDVTEVSGERLQLPLGPDPLDLFFRPGEADGPPVPDLLVADAAQAELRRAAITAARDEVRRLVMGYDVNPERGEKLAAFLEAPLPEGLSESFCAELSEIRHELSLFIDIEQLFIRAPRRVRSGDPVPSNYAQLRNYVRRLEDGGESLSDEFRNLLRAALPHYEATGLEYGEGLERAMLRILGSQFAPELRHRLVLASVRRIHALAARGISLRDDAQLANALERIAGMRGLIHDALADFAIETSYAIFQGPEIEREAERTSKDVDAWLAGAESEVTLPPMDVLTHLVNAPLGVFHRVGRWLDDDDPRRRAVAVAAYLCRLYANSTPSSHTSAVIGGILVERIDFVDGRIILGSVAKPGEMEPTFERLARAARAAEMSATVSREAPSGGIHAIELLVPIDDDWNFDALHAAVAPFLREGLPTQRLTLTAVTKDGRTTHSSFENGNAGLEEQSDLHALHPETAARIGLDRLQGFELERLDAPDDIFCFHLNSRDASGDERIFVLADVRGRSPDAGSEMTLHLPAFERAFLDASRTLRNALSLRDPRRRLHWNRLALFVVPPLLLDPDAVDRLTRRLYPVTRHLGLEKVIARLNVLDAEAPEQPARPVEIVIADPTGSHMEMSWRTPHHEALLPAREYERKVVAARRRKLVYPYEIIRMLENGAAGTGAELPPGSFEEFELSDAAGPPRAKSAAGRKPGLNPSSIVFGIIVTPTAKHPEGMRRVLILSDPTHGMGSLAAPECDRITAALDLAAAECLPVEWVPVSSGARIAMDSGTENLDATARVVRRIVTFTQAGGAIHILVQGVNVGAQSYFNALATMLQHTRGVLIMTPGASMVLTGRAALEASGSVSAEDETAIGGFERVMGPNGEAQYYAHNLVAAYQLLYDHYRYSYVAPGETGPRSAESADPDDRAVTAYPCERSNGHDFDTIGEIFDSRNADRKRPFAMRQLMQAVIDQDGGQLERWRNWEGAETAIVWDAHLGGQPVSLIGIESRNLPRGGDHDADGPAVWTGGTLFPQSSKKVARALNAASGNRPAVILANLSGFDGSPESMRKLQLEYGAEIARAVVNFDGPLVFLVVSRYHGGAYVVFSGALNEGLRPAALTGSFASVIGGGPAAAVVFSREVRARAATDPRVVQRRRAAQGSDSVEAREAFEQCWEEVLLDKQSEIAAEFDAIHSVERARDVGSLETLIQPEAMRPYLIEELRRGR
jgi:acetyl/propionyl-CoA carboxylase alpha subunit/acetyl-CoA carboxylase carboxyltransferase component